MWIRSVIAIVLSLYYAAVLADDPEAGMLLLGDGQPALLLETSIEIEVNGPLANIRLTQEFFNPGNEYASARYIFPLPENAAVNAMRMQVGDRWIIGDIAEKQVAQKTYETAKANGQQAALTERLSSNVFQTRVAQVSAGDQIRIELNYREILEPDGDYFSLRIPTTMTPRYWSAQTVPDSAKPVADSVAINTLQADTYAVPLFAAHYQSTESLPLEQLNILSLDMQLNPGLPIMQVSSSSHELAVQQDNTSNTERYRVHLLDQYEMMDRDLLISWQVVPAAEPRTVIMRQQLADANGMLHDYGLFMLQPPSPDYYQASKMANGLSREVVFIIDRSGSMGGESIRQAKASLAYALHSLNQADRFNIIDFSNTANQFASRSQLASQHHINGALQYINDLSAGGGTNMWEALDAAFAMPALNGYLRQVIFMTDGAVGDEQALLNMVEQKIADARLFTVAIGAAPNNFFMRKAAQIGRGNMHHVAAETELQAHMDILLAQLINPALTDIKFEFLDNGSVVTLDRQYLPDLYLGEPVIFTARFDQWPDMLQLTGFDGAPWHYQLGLTDVIQQSDGVAALWGKHRTDELYDNLMLGGSETLLKPQIIEIALNHQLLTPFTSFVAVEQAVVNPDNSGADEQLLANHLPKTGPMQLPATGLGLNALYALLLLVFTVWCWGLPVRWTEKESG